MAQPRGRELNPANLGPNALPPAEAQGPWAPSSAVVEVGAALASSSPHGEPDVAVQPTFRLVLPFGRAALAVDGAPLEAFWYSPASQRAWAPSQSEGVTRADVRVAATFQVSAGLPGTLLPAAALRVLLKTATGESPRNRRFTDAPAYQFDALLGWQGALGAGWRGEVVVNVGFLAWQQGDAGQNDALAWAVRGLLGWGPLALGLEGRGYVGWQGGDAPVTLAALAQARLAHGVWLTAQVARTLWDPPGWEWRLAVRFQLAPG